MRGSHHLCHLILLWVKKKKTVFLKLLKGLYNRAQAKIQVDTANFWKEKSKEGQVSR